MRCIYDAYYLHKAHSSFLLHRTLDSTAALGLGAILNSEITSKMHKNVKNMTLNILGKRKYLLRIWELKQGGRVWPCLTWTGNVPSGQFEFFAALPHVHEWLRKCHEYWFEGCKCILTSDHSHSVKGEQTLRTGVLILIPRSRGLKFQISKQKKEGPYIMRKGIIYEEN